MAAFEFGNTPMGFGRATPHAHAHAHPAPEHTPKPDAIKHSTPEIHPPKVIEEPILTMKIYDSCRIKECLGHSELGFARKECGGAVVPPKGSQSVLIDNLYVKTISVIKKETSVLRPGYWDLDVQYVLSYDLKFYGACGGILDTVCAVNSFNSRASLFGSVGQEVSIFNDLFTGDTLTGGGAPFVLVEAKAMPLTAEIRKSRCHEGHKTEHVFVTVGLFAIVKLYRLVSLLVESKGFVVPRECTNIMPPNPCDFFGDLDFPLDAFSPPKKREFEANARG